MESRVVTLLPAATEIVSALGLGERLVGRSHECDFPPDVARLPVCTAPRVDLSGPSEGIGKRIDALLSESLSVYRVDAARLRELAPTHVVTQVACDVCAVTLSDVARALSDWTGSTPALVGLEASDLDGVFRDIGRVAESLESPVRGTELVAALARRMDAVTERARAVVSRPRVATIEWISPLMSAGNWMPEIVTRAGGEDLFGAAGKHSGRVAWEGIREADPDAILVFPCGLALDRVRREADVLASRSGWDRLSAVRRGRVFLADGNQLFNRPGPRLAETLEAVAEMLHPELFRFGHEGLLWERYSGGREARS